MSITTLVGFLTVKDKKGTVQDRYQNAKRDNFNSLTNDDGDYIKNKDNVISFDEDKNGKNSNYYFLPFLYQGAAKNRSGDNLEAALIFANNKVAMNKAHEAVKNKWTVQVDVCKVNPTTLAWERTLTTEIWLAASMSYDPSTIEVLLSSGIDAVGSNAPNRVLTSHLCGHLPTSGQIRNA
tara:strand:- start:131 stop:670 length:540 start_codon:yes stop_codon:yes gene_type:complete